MAGVDYKSAPIELRERIAFNADEVRQITGTIIKTENVSGCVIVSTCNRTEIYISSDEKVDAAAILFKGCGVDYSGFENSVFRFYDYAAVLYCCEVACGLHSAILGEEQIVTQIGDAIELSRAVGAADSVLNTMFRCAVTAGKKALTDFSIRAVPLSAPQIAVSRADAFYGGLGGKRALIIGNGKMGLLAADALIKKGCGVCITLRRYKHGDNIVPEGAQTIDYSRRMEAFEKSDFIISATRSPHYTVFESDVRKCTKMPDCIFDLAVPRDIEPGTEKYIKCYNIDDLCSDACADKKALDGIRRIARECSDDFMHWAEYKEGLK